MIKVNRPNNNVELNYFRSTELYFSFRVSHRNGLPSETKPQSGHRLILGGISVRKASESSQKFGLICHEKLA